MTFGYCEKCEQNVLLKREKINNILAIILLIFTAGIGLLIYIWIHSTKEKVLCIHCGTYALPITNIGNNQLSTDNIGIQNQNNPYMTNSDKNSNYARESIIQISGDKVNSCSLCGQEIKDHDGEYCPYCGEKR